eukprot:353457-Chlamydomonas_euryale.AAC.3
MQACIHKAAPNITCKTGVEHRQGRPTLSVLSEYAATTPAQQRQPQQKTDAPPTSRRDNGQQCGAHGTGVVVARRQVRLPSRPRRCSRVSRRPPCRAAQTRCASQSAWVRPSPSS